MFNFRDELVGSHLERVHFSLLGGYSFETIPQWICENTNLRGRLFSFLDHEYQLKILNDQSQNVNVRKCSQIGISEMSVRLALAEANIIPGFTVIYTMPTALAAQQFAKTRVDLVIQNSPKLLANLNPDNDSAAVKQFGDSFVYIKGTKGSAAAISVPADHLIHDELDFSDLEVVSNYHSRLTHSPYKKKTNFSTPTVEKYGISSQMDRSRRHFNFCKCNHCSHQFVPDYFNDVDLPGFTANLKDLSRDNVHLYDVRKAVLRCPKCKLVPDLSPAHREWVCENPMGDPDTAGYQISPFDAPKIITCADLLTASVRYQRHADFVNFSLGLPSEDKESSITKEDMESIRIHGAGSGYLGYVMGIDVGQTCYLMVAGMTLTGIDVLVSEALPVTQLESRKAELKAQFPIRSTVMDSMPYFELLLRMQTSDYNMWGAYFSTMKDLDLYRLKAKEDDEDKGQLYIRQIDINRNRAFDALLENIRAKNIHIKADESWERIVEHCTDMKRIRAFESDGESSYKWQKSSDKNDHFHHTLLYTWLASKTTGLSGNLISSSPLFSKFKVKESLAAPT